MAFARSERQPTNEPLAASGSKGTHRTGVHQTEQVPGFCNDVMPCREIRLAFEAYNRPPTN